MTINFWDSLITLVQVVLVSLALLFAFLTYRHIKAVDRVKFYVAQGMSPTPGWEKFIQGNIDLALRYEKLCGENAGKNIVKHISCYFMDNVDPQGRVDSYEAAKHPVPIMNMMGTVHVIVADPIMVQDLFITKNEIFDKTGTFEGIFSKLLHNSFLFSKGDAIWKAKRKACAHAFYKERLVLMLELLKDKIEGDCNKWTEQIDRS